MEHFMLCMKNCTSARVAYVLNCPFLDGARASKCSVFSSIFSHSPIITKSVLYMLPNCARSLWQGGINCGNTPLGLNQLGSMPLGSKSLGFISTWLHFRLAPFPLDLEAFGLVKFVKYHALLRLTICDFGRQLIIGFS